MIKLKIGCCGGAERVKLYQELGFDYIEPPVSAVAEEEDFLQFVKVLEAAEINAEVFNCFIPASLPIIGPNVDQSAINKYLNTVMPRIERLGGKIIVFGSGKARRIPSEFPVETAHRQLAIFLDMATEAAEERLRIVIEPLNSQQTNLLNSVSQTRKVCKQMGWRVGLLADLFHMTKEGEPLENLIPVSKLEHIHLPFPEEEYPVAGFLENLKEGRYQHRISLEDNGGFLAGATDEEQREKLAIALTTIKSSI